jgi:hypothetical protein
MSDTIDFGTPPDPGPASAPAPAAAPAAPAAPSDDLFANPVGDDQPLVSRGFAENLRAEGLKYRTDLRATQEQLSGYEAVFGGYEQADRDVWFDLARTWQTDPARAAATMQAIANAVMDEQGGTPPADTPTTPQGTPPDMTPDANGLLTQDQVQAMIDAKLGERDQRAHEDSMVNQVLTEVRAEGIDPDGIEGMMVLWTASNKTNGDVKAAANELRAYRQSIIDGYVQGRANGTPPTPSGGGVPGTELPQVGSWDDIRKGAARFMESASSNG